MRERGFVALWVSTQPHSLVFLSLKAYPGLILFLH